MRGRLVAGNDNVAEVCTHTESSLVGIGFETFLGYIVLSYTSQEIGSEERLRNDPLFMSSETLTKLPKW